MSLPTVFISYSQRDEAARAALVSHLGVLVREGYLEVWDDQRLKAGDDWMKEIESSLANARVAILLVSADFLNSQFVRGVEVPRLLERRQADGLRVMPVIIRPCVWKAIPWLSALQVRPKKTTPILGMSAIDQEAAWSAIAEEAYQLLREGDVGHKVSTPTAATISEPASVPQDAEPAGELISETITLEAGTYFQFPLEMSRGDKLEGKLIETTGQNFDYFISDEPSLADFVSGENYEVEDGGVDRPAYAVDWRAPRKGPWQLILNGSGKRVDREVEVELRIMYSRKRK